MFELATRIESALEDIREALECPADGLKVAEAAEIARKLRIAHERLAEVMLIRERVFTRAATRRADNILGCGGSRT